MYKALETRQYSPKSEAMASQPKAEVVWARSQKRDLSRTGLLDLPRELRDMVYENALCATGAIFIYSSDPDNIRHTIRAKIVREKDLGPQEPQSAGNSISAALLRTCRQLHSEGAAFLYGKNLFRMYTTKAIFDSMYHSLVMHITFITDADHRIYENDLETASYWWRRRFWPQIIEKSTRLLEMYPRLESLNVPIKSNYMGRTWRPAFMASDLKTREQRVALAVTWMKTNCPFESNRVRGCLHLEIMPAIEVPDSEEEEETIETRVARIRARVAELTGRTLFDEDWDCTEFSEAFERMKLSGK
ncbi:hypothetical protein BCR34DRAFT_558945 [Clohesyomyces aquaticus]|uniref:DUF7730 domain-containing protein n=1 Tax=Clohesyomyces aquaticus TaxID=1231657 RepID=A0A1Y1ZYG4_9PLEO|nr:hypothetical protein BCR34DRAFT_558945 [Clohesyomyces aquaticus]